MPIPITMPALSPTMEEGSLAKWLVKEGDSINAGDVIAEIETDKATMEVEAVEEGTLGKILIGEGTEGVAVNTPIAVLLEEGEDDSALEGFDPGGASPAPAPKEDAAPAEPAQAESGAPEPKPQTPHPEEGAKAPVTKGEAPASAPATTDERKAMQTEAGGERIKASPLARRLAQQAGVDLASIKGSGPGGRIVKADVEGAPAGEAAPAAAQEAKAPAGKGPLDKFGIPGDRYELKAADNIQKVSAKRLAESFRDIPHFPLTVDIEIDALLDLRKQVNAAAPEGVKVSVNDMLIKASAIALRDVPAANASWVEEGGQVALHKHADVSVAVAIEGGLITPIVKDAETKSLSAISAEMKDLAARARERKLKPDEFQGGTFSLSNLGMFGIKTFASIINPPQGMILSVGAGEERPVVKDGALAKANVMTVTLTCDHRVVDGATGAKWLSRFKELVEAPLTMLI